jgi:hypothetical protein
MIGRARIAELSAAYFAQLSPLGLDLAAALHPAAVEPVRAPWRRLTARARLGSSGLLGREEPLGGSVASVDHRMVWRRGRPGRAAVLIPSPGGDWIPLAGSALCSLSLTWGGMGDILVPVCADGGPHPAFRAVMRAHDPDYVAAYQAMWSEIALADPGAYAGWRTNRAGSSDPADDEAELRQQFETEAAGSRGPGNRLPRSRSPGPGARRTRPRTDTFPSRTKARRSPSLSLGYLRSLGCWIGRLI